MQGVVGSSPISSTIFIALNRTSGVNMLYLMRHGKTDWNTDKKIQGQYNMSLNEQGRHQVRIAAKDLQLYNVDRIVSSDLARAAETADIVGGALRLRVTYDSRLREYDFGMLTGKSKQDLTPDMMMTLITKPHIFGAETFGATFRRVANFIQQVDFNQNTLVVTHGGIMYFAMCFFENHNKLNIESLLDKHINTKIDNTAVFRVQNINSKMQRIR